MGNLPLVLVAALCEDPSSQMAAAVAPGYCLKLGVAYVVFAMWVAGLFQFSVAYMLLRPDPQVTTFLTEPSDCAQISRCDLLEAL